MDSRSQLTRVQRTLIIAVVLGATAIAVIGFVGSYAAVRALAQRKGFGEFSAVLPVGVDVGIAVLLALDLVLTWLRIPFPLLRQTAWLLTGGTIVFNAAASLGDPLAMAMHAIIPVLFVVVVEAARHAVGRIADITADRHMDSVRLARWLLSPVSTFRLWRQMKLWELRSYEDVVRLEQHRMVYRTRLRAAYGRTWRRTAPVEALLPLRLARFGVPLPALMPPDPAPASVEAEPPPQAPAVVAATAPPPARRRPPAGTSSTTPPPGPAVQPAPAARRPKKAATSPPAAPALQVPEPSADEKTALAAARTKADAIRVALSVLPQATDDQAVIAWLKAGGCDVNRGQVFNVRKKLQQTAAAQQPHPQAHP